jgi:hypothetical protein
MLGEAVACGAFQKYTQTDLLPHYIRKALPHIWDIHILEEEEGLHTFH